MAQLVPYWLLNATSHKDYTMKKLFVAALAGITMTGLSAFACGGMTQINPPSLQLDAGPSQDQMESIVPELAGLVVLC
jgi:hypothetical protein